MTENPVSHPLAERIASLRLPGMHAAFLEQVARNDLDDMPFEDRLALLIDREIAERRSRALQRRLKRAQLRHQDACFEDINLSRPRGLDRSLVLGLADCAWVRNGANILITGPCGTGKSSYELSPQGPASSTSMAFLFSPSSPRLMARQNVLPTQRFVTLLSSYPVRNSGACRLRDPNTASKR